MSVAIERDANTVRAILSRFQPTTVLLEMLPKLVALLPSGVSFDSDIWNLVRWITRAGNKKIYNVYFIDINNCDIRQCLKIFILYKRLTLKIGVSDVQNYFGAVKYLDRAVLLKDVKLIRNADFYQAEKLISINCKGTAPERVADALQGFGEWLNWSVGIPISYVLRINQMHLHGRKASEESRQAKLISNSVIHELIASNNRPDISVKDRFFLSAFVIFVATGFRIDELATMPKKCLLDKDGIVSLLFFPEKHGELSTRYIPSEMVPSVTAAIDYLISITDQGRKAVHEIRCSPPPDWSAILDDTEATNYFVRKFAQTWTANPLHRMINPNGAWFEREKKIIDIIEIVKMAGSKSAAARQLSTTRATIDGLLVAHKNALEGKLPNKMVTRGRMVRNTWDTDSRVISVEKFSAFCGIVLKETKIKVFRHIIKEAQREQLAGHISPGPLLDLDLESRFKRTVRPVITDKNENPLLEPEDALFVIPRYLLSSTRETKDGDYRLISAGIISRWLNGESRSHGTGNHEDSCFNRLGIKDPKTGNIVKFTSHDIRHWLDTTYAEGQMDEYTIAKIFGRKLGSNHIYDQTSKKHRLENLRQAVRDGGVMGHITDNYRRLLASYSRTEAEQFLMAYTLMVNIMPHGACTLNWGLEPCPHYLGCLSKVPNRQGPCEHFVVDKNDPAEIAELRRIARETKHALSVIPEQSPQHENFRGINENLNIILADNQIAVEGYHG